MEDVESMCGWCGASVCDWERVGSELTEAGVRLVVKLTRRRQRGRAVRTALRRLYMYWKHGSMSGDVPKCITRELNQRWPDVKDNHRFRRGKQHPAHRAVLEIAP